MMQVMKEKVRSQRRDTYNANANANAKRTRKTKYYRKNTSSKGLLFLGLATFRLVGHVVIGIEGVHVIFLRV